MAISSILILSIGVFAASLRYYFIRWIILRFETLIGLAATSVLLLYIRWLVSYYRPHIQGLNLEPYALVNRNKLIAPALLDIGLGDIPRYPGGRWRWKSKIWSFYADRGNRPYMEDRMHYMNDPFHNISIFSIFDGHGGPFVSQYLEEHFSGAIFRRLLHGSRQRQSLTGHLEESVTQAIVTEVHNIDDAISRLNPSLTALTGSTLISVILERYRFLTVINVGDSRAVACDFTGRAVPLSADHKPTDERERRRIESAGGFIQFRGVDRVQGILSVSRAFGDTDLKRLCVLTAQPDVVRIDLSEISLKFILIASDGFWDVLSNEKAINLAQTFINASSPNQWHKVAEYLVKKALILGTDDNVSVMFLRLY